MDVINQKDTVPFTTADGSTIRELLAHRNSSIRQQSLAEARLAKLELQLKGETDAAEEEVLKNRIKDLKKKIRERERTIDGLY